MPTGLLVPILFTGVSLSAIYILVVLFFPKGVLGSVGERSREAGEAQS